VVRGGVLVGAGTRAGVLAGAAALLEVAPPVPAGAAAPVAGTRAGVRVAVAAGAGRAPREAGFDARTEGAGLTVPAGFTPAAGCGAGAALAMAAARAPVETTVAAATPFVTSDSLRRARSR
jgi:hypothetical protein